MEPIKHLKVTPAPETVNTVIPETPPAPVEIPKNDSRLLIIAEIILLVVLGVLGTIWFRKSLVVQTKDMPSSQPTPSISTLSPTPIPLKSGSEIYRVSQSSRKGPEITTVTMDPLDVLKGQTLTVIADINDESDVKEVTGSLEMDSSKINFVFTREAGSSKNGSWKTEVKLTDSVFYIYTLTINARSASGINTIKVTPR